jgi:hypothetical protein
MLEKELDRFACDEPNFAMFWFEYGLIVVIKELWFFCAFLKNRMIILLLRAWSEVVFPGLPWWARDGLLRSLKGRLGIRCTIRSWCNRNSTSRWRWYIRGWGRFLVPCRSDSYKLVFSTFYLYISIHFIVSKATRTEINDLQTRLILLLQQNIFRLQVAVNNTLLVHRMQS